MKKSFVLSVLVLTLAATLSACGGGGFFFPSGPNTQPGGVEQTPYLLFGVNDGPHYKEPWITDGAVAGTKLLKDINTQSGSEASNFVKVGNVWFFNAYDPTHGTELWKSDGTAAGTALVKDINTTVSVPFSLP